MDGGLHIIALITLLTAVFASAAPAAPAAPTGCQPIDGARLQAYLSTRPDIKSVVFFAAWCRDCKIKIEAAGKDDILVAVFETQERADQIWSDVNQRRNPCFIDTDDAVAKAFGVKSLPYTWKR